MGNTKRPMWAAVVALVIAGGASNAMLAQTNEEFDKIFPFLGQWDAKVGSPDGQDRGNCGGQVGDYGEKLVNCTMPVGRLPLNSRAQAWLQYRDQLQSPTQADCAQLGYPAVLGDGEIFIAAYPGRIITEHPSNPWHITRTVWMNGTGPKPIPGELFQHGISRGRFDGNDLIIETTHFTFDPDGIDDHFRMASSVRKKVTERYRLIDDDNMRLIITLEDPTFLTKPFTYAFVFAKTGMAGPRQGWRECDGESARREQEYSYPATKYLDAR
ncbi:MAG: hypothetical protein AB7I50_13140 [Vicinamibacterales bacterium]